MVLQLLICPYKFCRYLSETLRIYRISEQRQLILISYQPFVIAYLLFAFTYLFPLLDTLVPR